MYTNILLVAWKNVYQHFQFLKPCHSICLVFSSLVCYKLFCSVWKETSPKPLKVAAAKKSLQSVYIIDTTCFDEFFLLHLIIERHLCKSIIRLWLVESSFIVPFWVIPCQMDQNFKGLDIPISDFGETFQMKSMYEIRLSWKFQHKLISCSKVMTPQSWHGQLKIDKTKEVRQLGCIWVSRTFFVLNPKFSNLLQRFSAWRTIR